MMDGNTDNNKKFEIAKNYQNVTQRSARRLASTCKKHNVYKVQ